MLKCELCDARLFGQDQIAGMSHAYVGTDCIGVLREVKADAQQRAEVQAQWEGALPDITALAGLKQAARLKAGVALIDPDELAKLREENASLKERVARHEQDYDSERRLTMSLRDAKGDALVANQLRLEAMRELDFAKNELYRLDPRLATARWGRR
jgi:hypothetical protein